jgi:hypothetical protein
LDLELLSRDETFDTGLWMVFFGTELPLSDDKGVETLRLTMLLIDEEYTGAF